MIEHFDNTITLRHDDGWWIAVHDASRLDGPIGLTVGDDTVLTASSVYLDDMTAESAVVTRAKAYRKGGAAVVETAGYLPFGGKVCFAQTCRYAANHVRMTLDVKWPRGTPVHRHFGVGTLFLPGAWRRFWCLPPAAHAVAGAQPAWREIADGGTGMIGHWHRPPLALVFERADGTALEVGTGSDLWRWDDCLGYGPESGSYKIMQEADGIRVIREPLMCCEQFAPAVRPYRFTWYMAWDGRRRPTPAAPSDTPTVMLGPHGVPPDVLAGDAAPRLALDIAAQSWPEASLHSVSPGAFVRGERQPAPCWESPPMQKLLRRVVRQLKARADAGHLAYRNVTPAPCWDPNHVGRRAPDGLAHWDLAAILDYAVWTRHQLGPDWTLTATSQLTAEMPSMRGLFGLNGFAAEAEMV